MAMLAEPRRRKRYNLCPRGKALYEDDSRFGTKMLEKMGWSKGRGLGAKEDGQQEFVRVRFKNDAEGLGFEARDDQWTTHEEGFNGLLKALNGEANDDPNNEVNGASASEDELRPAFGFGFKNTESAPPVEKKQLKEKISGVSLEEKSKVSRARVHYKKFTRGKDLSQYSEKDLANIFGKKATDDIEEPIKEATPPVEEADNPNFAGVQTVSTGLSVNDYFKQKMDAMKNRLKNGSDTKLQRNGSDEDKEEEKVDSDPIDEPSKKKKKKKDKERPVDEQPEATEEPLPKKKKKSKKTIENVEESKENEPEPEYEDRAAKKKKKKNKSKVNETVVVPVEPSELKKKKRDKAEKETEEPKEQHSEEPPKKKKKKSKKNNEDSETLTQQDEVVSEIKKSKKKKSKDADEEILLEELPKEKCDELLVDDLPSKGNSKKSGKKFKDENKEDVLPTDSVSAAKSSGDISNSSTSSTEIEMNDELLSLEQLHSKLKSFDIFEISTFCAEKFQMFNMSAFNNASLHQLPGYGVSENIQLKIVDQPNDAQRLIDLWNNCGTSYHKAKSTRNKYYPSVVKRSTIRAVKKKKAFSTI